MKRALKSREKAVLNNNPTRDGVSVEPSNDIPHRTTRRSGTQAAMIGLAISMGATSILVTRQSDQAQAAAPVGTQKAASTIPAKTETEIKFAATKLESQAVSSARAPENPVIVEPKAVSQVPGLEAKWPVAATEVAALPTLEANGKAVYLPVSVEEGANKNSVQSQIKTEQKLSQRRFETASSTTAVNIETANTVNKEVDQQLKAQQEFALNRLQEKSNRLRNSLAELRREENQSSLTTEQTATEKEKPTKVASNAKSVEITNTDQISIINKLKQDELTDDSAQKAVTPVTVRPTLVASASTTYEVKPGDTLAEIASQYGTSVSEIVKANNLDDPNRLQINQKLIIPTDSIGNIAQNNYAQPKVQTKVTAVPVFVQPQNNNKIKNTVVVNPVLSKPDLEANLPSIPETPVAKSNNTVAIPVPVVRDSRTVNNASANNSSISIPVPVVENNQPPTQETLTATAKTNSAVDENNLINRLAEKPEPQNQPQQVSKIKGTERIRTLQAEIERLREKYRTQQADVTVAVKTENETPAVPVVVDKDNKDFTARENSQQKTVAIPVPKPTLPSSQEQPTRLLLSATRREPINPQFSSNQNSLGNSSNRSSRVRINVPPANMNSNDSLGRLRGTRVSPSSKTLPPLAAVDRHLPQAVDPTTNPGKPHIWPSKGVLTSGYGWRWGRMHRGIDIANSVGTPIYASASGVVERAGWNRGGYGNLVDIRHPDGSLTRYAHNSRILVRVGQGVEQGQTIAAMGSTGFSTGPHLHFEIHSAGKGAINPIALLPKERL
ncbi:MAG: peptidoglycan DD-metalloendopeptidase family protein [Sphaerospermopsis sp. SIO1G2]|nr:peptidoglycan DD-metalloendopeptidase family protein [Sphaerospermopsis sp. SIO1G2]